MTASEPRRISRTATSPSIPRNGVDFTHRFRQLLPTLAALPCRSAIVDGEIIACDPDGKPDFAALMRKGPRPAVSFVAFDVLALDGTSLLAEPIETRRAALTQLLRGAPRAGGVMISETFEDGTALLEACERLGLEGIVSKRRASRYRSGPAHNWLKVKTTAWRQANRAHFRRDRVP